MVFELDKIEVRACPCLPEGLKAFFLTRWLGATGTYRDYSPQKVRVEQTVLQNGLVEKLVFRRIYCRCIYSFHLVQKKNADTVSGTRTKDGGVS